MPNHYLQPYADKLGITTDEEFTEFIEVVDVVVLMYYSSNNKSQRKHVAKLFVDAHEEIKDASRLGKLRPCVEMWIAHGF